MRHLHLRAVQVFFTRGVYPERSEGLVQNDTLLLVLFRRLGQRKIKLAKLAFLALAPNFSVV